MLSNFDDIMVVKYKNTKIQNNICFYNYIILWLSGGQGFTHFQNKHPFPF